MKDPLTRRRFAELSARSLLGVNILPGASQLRAQASRAKAGKVLYFYMGGALSHIDTFDPKPGSDTQGPTGVTGTNGDFQLSANLEALKNHGDKIVPVRTMTSRTGDHNDGRYYVRTGYKRLASIVHPDLAAWKKRLAPLPTDTSLPWWVSLGDSPFPGPGFMGPAYAPLPLGNPESGLPNSRAQVDAGTFEDRIELMNTFNEMFTRKFRTKEVHAYNEFYTEAMKVMESEDLAAFDLSRMPPARRAKFGTGRWADATALAVQLNEADVQWVTVNMGSWDFHNTIFEPEPTRKFKDMAQAIAGVLAEANLEDTLIVLTTEFGRTPKINPNAGRDHHPLAFSAMLAGAGIKGGQAYGATDAKGYAVQENPVTAEDLNATIATALGIPLDKVIFSPSGRPFLVAGHKEKAGVITPVGKPIHDILS